MTKRTFTSGSEGDVGACSCRDWVGVQCKSTTTFLILFRKKNISRSKPPSPISILSIPKDMIKIKWENHSFSRKVLSHPFPYFRKLNSSRKVKQNFI